MIDGTKKKAAKVLPKKNNATSGKKAHNDNKYYKVGRIRRNSWANAVLGAYDIVVSEQELVHIKNKHNTELLQLGMTAFDFVKFIADNYNVVYKGTGASFLLVVKREYFSSQAAIEVAMFDKSSKYRIKTATPVKTKQLGTKKILCEKT
jgi:hypothetical protein